MKILLTADWHIDAMTAGIARVDELDPFLDELDEVITREQVSHLIHLGDFFNPGGMLCSFYTAKIIESVNRFLDNDWLETITLIAGNHDVIESSRGITTITPVAQAFPCEPRVRVFEQPTAFTLGYEDQRVRGIALPFVARAAYDENRLSGALEGAEKFGKLGGWPLIVVGHMTVPGAVVGSETQDMPRGREFDLPTFEIRKLKPSLIANGHYHRAQVVEGSDVVIPGSPFRFTFGEKDDKRKGYTIIELNYL